MSGLSLRGVCRRYGTRAVVDHLDLDVQDAEIVSLLGPSGCGKTTTLRMVAGLDRPDAGEVHIDGEVVAGPRWVPPERRGLGMVFQSFALWPHRTVRENVAYPLRMRGGDVTEADRLLDRVRLGGFGDRSPATLSGGQQQRVALARALAGKPRALLLDEPLSALDATLRGELRALIAEVVREHRLTVLLVTHDPEEALELSDRIGVMRAGKIAQLATPATLYESPVDRATAEALGAISTVAADRRGAVVSVGGVHVGDSAGPDGPVTWAFRPEWAAFAEEGVPCAVEATFYAGATRRTRVRVGEHAFEVRGVAAPTNHVRLTRGWAWVDP